MITEKLKTIIRLFCSAPLAQREAERLARVMWRRTYREVAPDWQPWPDTVGLISQIDNMHAGVVEDNEKLRCAAMKFAATVIMLDRRALRLPPESELFEEACAELNRALLPNAR